MAETCDTASSGWLKLVALCLFRAQSSINPFATVLGQDRKVIDQHSVRNYELSRALALGEPGNFR